MEKSKPNAFVVFFTKLPQLLLAGLLFSFWSALWMAVSVLTAKVSGFNNILVWGLGIIPSTVFLPGLVMVIRKYAVEKNYVPVIPTFFGAVRENAKDFIFHGFVIYLIFASSFFALLYYFTMAQSDIVFAYVLVIYILFTAVMIIMLFYMPLMAVTYELRYRDIYKNSLLLIFGKILTNLLTFVMVGVLVGAGVMLLVVTEGVWRIVCAVLLSAVLPCTLCYIVISMISKGLQENVGSFVPKEAKSVNDLSQEEQQVVNSADSDDDYIYVNGKMVKNPNKK